MTLHTDDPQLVAVVSHGDSRSHALLVDAISASHDGDIAIVSITACSLLGEHAESDRPGGALHQAIRDGARCRLLVLDPDCREAEVRISIESPGIDPAASVLRRDALAALAHLNASWSGLAERLIARQSSVGLAFNLWITPNTARVEPYHLGQTPEGRDDPKAPFEGLVHVWFGRGRKEYALLVDHFEQLWNRSAARWPAR